MTGKEALKRIGHLEYGCDYLENPTPLKVSGEYKTIEKELDELTKYKRAFEIFTKDKELTLHKSKEPILGTDEYKLSFVNWKSLTKEEYELLEELMEHENTK